MDNKQVSEDRFNAEIRRIDERIDTVLGRIDDKMDAFMSRIDAKFARMEGQIDNMKQRLNWIESFIGWTIGLTAILIAVGSLIIQVIMK